MPKMVDGKIIKFHGVVCQYVRVAWSGNCWYNEQPVCKKCTSFAHCYSHRNDAFHARWWLINLETGERLGDGLTQAAARADAEYYIIVKKEQKHV